MYIDTTDFLYQGDKMSRRIARDYAYKLIFEGMFNQNDQTDITKDTLLEDSTITASDKEYMDTVTYGVKEHYNELIELIKNNSKNFKVERIFKTDLSALLLACYEMKYVCDIPMAVSICEIVDLVKCYSTDKSSVFVNGVLAGVCKELSSNKSSTVENKIASVNNPNNNANK